MKTDLFQSCGHCHVFQIWRHNECSTFTAWSLRIWNSSTGIPSPPLALFLVMLPKSHLTSHSRMSGSRGVITPLWLSGWWRSFLYRSSVYSCHPLKMGEKDYFKKCNHNHESWPFLLPLSVWDNDNKVAWVDLPAGKHGLFVGETLRSGSHLPGDSSWAQLWGWGGLRSCKETSNYVPGGQNYLTNTALTEGGYCSRDLLVCSCGSWDCHKN